MSEMTDYGAGRNASRTTLYQLLAVLLCVALGLAMIVNNQMGGEGMWFWYATVFHEGAKLYADLHIALQPLFLLLTDGWMTVFGHRLLVTQVPSVFEIAAMCVGLLLVMRESAWPDWQKAVVLLGSFCLTVSGHSYRFDDYHVLSENFILYALVVLLLLGRVRTNRRQLGLTATLGLLAGLTITTRVTDGAALLAAGAICQVFLVTRRRWSALGVYFLAAALTVLGVVWLTGDTAAAYLSNSIFHAAGSKGGTGSIFAAPFLVLANVLPLLLMVGKQALVILIAMVAIGPLTARFWKAGRRYVFGLELAFAAMAVLLVSNNERRLLREGVVISTVVLIMIPLLYVLAAVVLARWLRNTRQPDTWDRREILVLLPLAEWASYSAGAAAEPLTNYYAPMALLLLLVPILQPFRRGAVWANPSYLALMALLSVSTLTSKAIVPYSWQNYKLAPMFQDRVWYSHPVYGPMYMDRALLRFSEQVCRDIGAEPGLTKPSMLSLPYPFPNYFCDTPPWHNYVQTFFDTSTRATIEQLMRELNATPPDWIVYQRQLNIMTGAERLYNHGRPLAQRDLDTLIQRKLHD